MRKSTDERLQELQEKQAQLKAQEKALRAKQQKEDRKKRGSRLIQIGAAVEAVLGRPIEKEDLPKLIDYLEKQEQKGKYFSKAMEK